MSFLVGALFLFLKHLASAVIERTLLSWAEHLFALIWHFLYSYTAHPYKLLLFFAEKRNGHTTIAAAGPFSFSF